MHDWIERLQEVIAREGQSAVARRLGCSDALVSQLKRGHYTGDVDKYRRRFEAEYSGDATVECPVLGEIDRRACHDNRHRPFAATNPTRVRLWKACRTCENNPDAGAD